MGYQRHITENILTQHSPLEILPELYTRNMPPALQHTHIKRKRHPDVLTQDWQHEGEKITGQPTPTQVTHDFYLLF